MKTKDGRLSYFAAGNPSLPPLVFLHGIGGAARAWHGQLDFFKHRYRTIAWTCRATADRRRFNR
jgi:3-oxoadipate enol-lactonase